MGGGANDDDEAGETGLGSSLVLTEVEEEEVSEVALMDTVLLGTFLGNGRVAITENCETLRAPAMAIGARVPGSSEEDGTVGQ